jgi:hypothetical protein
MELKPDAEKVIERFEAWWECEIVDRPLVSMSFARSAEEQTEPPGTQHETHADRWLDTEYQAALAAAQLSNRHYVGDALPIVHPNFGPDVFASFYGCPLVFGERTSWSEPILDEWDEAGRLMVDRKSVYYRKINELTDHLLELGRDRFIVGYTDLHPGGDAVAALRDPQQLCFDVIEHPREVSRLVERITDEFLHVFDIYHDRLSRAGMPSTTWLHAVSRGRMHVPSNDFSCMISAETFGELFLPGIVRECRHMDHNIYHLDGPDALRHLSLLLEVPEIQAIQWVPGAGRDYWRDWIPVYRQIQQAGRAIVLSAPVEDLETVFDVLRPHGAWIQVSGVEDLDTANTVVDRFAHWR